MAASNQETLFAYEPDSGSEQKPDSDDVLNKKNVKGPLDELFGLTFQCKTSNVYQDLLQFECVMKTAGLIDKMGRENLKPRKENRE